MDTAYFTRLSELHGAIADAFGKICGHEDIARHYASEAAAAARGDAQGPHTGDVVYSQGIEKDLRACLKALETYRVYIEEQRENMG